MLPELRHAPVPRAALEGAAQLAAILPRIRASPVNRAEETGWQERGRNGYAWLFALPGAQYFVHGSREGARVHAVLGPAIEGVLVTGFYTAYDH